MRSRPIRRIAQIVIIGAVVALAITAVLPLAASTRIVRDRVAQELSTWTGYRVQLAAAPEIRIWPSFGARLSRVSFSEPGADGATILSADRMELDLSAMAALRGLVVFKEVNLVRPVLRVNSEGGRLSLPHPPAGGQFARATGSARRLIEQDPGRLDLTKLPSIPFGTVNFSDGRIVVDADGTASDLVTSISGRVDWPQLGSGGRLDANGIWNGETVKASVNSSQMLFLLSGGDAPVEIRAESAFANAVFSGNITLGRSLFMNGHATLSSPAFGRLLEWLRLRPGTGPMIGELSLAGTVVGDLDRFKLENVEMQVQGSAGNGVIEITLGETPRRVAGTLAFQQLDLSVLLGAFGPIAASLQFPDQPIDMSFTDRLGVDLRLSASQAVAGALSLGNLAAAAQVSPGFAAFDISDATLFGGTLQASMRLDRKEGRNQAEIRVNGRQLDMAALAQAADIKRILPIGRADVSAMLKGSGESWQAIMELADGTLGARFGPGNIPGLDINALLARATQGGFFPLSLAATGSTPIGGADVKAKVNNGAIQIDTAELKLSGDRIMRISGLVPWMGQGLALSGDVRPSTAPTDQAARQDGPNLFIGGSWLSPYVWSGPAPGN